MPSFKPPERVASAARRGLRLRKKVKGGTDVGVARARQLSNRQPVSLETIGRMVSYFARHGAQRPTNPGTDAKSTPWLVAWLLWGGDAGRKWAESVWRREGEETRALQVRTLGAVLDDDLPAPDDAGTVLGAFKRVIASGPLHNKYSGAAMRPLTASDIEACAAWVNANAQSDALVWNWDHKRHAKGPLHLSVLLPLGRIVEARVERDDARTYLAVRSLWTPHGVKVLTEGRGALWPSLEWLHRPGYDRDTGAEQACPITLVGCAVTPDPAYAPGVVDAVELRSIAFETDSPLAGINDAREGMENGMTPEEMATALDALLADFAALRETVGALAAKVDGETAEDRGYGPEEMRSLGEHLSGVGDKLTGLTDGLAAVKAQSAEVVELRSTVAGLTDRLNQQEAEARVAVAGAEFDAHCAANLRDPHEREGYVQLRSAALAGDEGATATFNSIFGEDGKRTRAAAPAVEMEPPAAEPDPLAPHKAWFEARNLTFNMKDPAFSANFAKCRAALKGTN